jgi:predicted RecA/RadA family phage recombinase
MKTFSQPGDVLEFTAPATVTVDEPVVIGNVLVVPTVSAASGDRFNGLVRGVIIATKVGSQAWAEGAIVYYDEDNTRFTTVAAGHHQAGFAVGAVGSGAGETTGTVSLDGLARVNEDT